MRSSPDQPSSCPRCGVFQEATKLGGLCSDCTARESANIPSLTELCSGWLLQTSALALAPSALWARAAPSSALSAFLLLLAQSLAAGLLSILVLRQAHRKKSAAGLLLIQALVALGILILAPTAGSLSIPATLALAACALAIPALIGGSGWLIPLWGLICSYASMVAVWHIIEAFNIFPQAERLSLVASHGLWTGLGHWSLLDTWLDLSVLTGSKAGQISH